MAIEHTGNARPPLRLGIAGLGAIGLGLARDIDSGRMEGVVLTAVAARDLAKTKRAVAGFANPPKAMAAVDLAEAADVVVECAPAAAFLEIARPVVERGRVFMPLSVGALLDHPELVALARETGARIVVPTGALVGLDTVKAVTRGQVHSITMVTRKPPAGLKGAPHLVANHISVEGLNEAKLVFSGSAREAARGFPANLNVGAALALAGIGPDETRIEIWADPQVRHNTHTIEVKSDSADFTMTIQNVPTQENPRTGKVVRLSVLAALERLTAPLVIGT